MKALVLANGELYEPGVLLKRVQAEVFDLVLAADAGARHAHTLDVALNAIIGDMDSISDLERQAMGLAEPISYPAEKDEIDLELTLLHARERGADRIVVTGVMGGRIDMSIANILLLTHPDLSSCRIEVWHGSQTGWLIRPPGDVIEGNRGDTVSLIPLGEDASGITTSGLKHALNRGRLTFGPARGVSNLMEQPSASIAISRGLVLAVHTPGRA